MVKLSIPVSHHLTSIAICTTCMHCRHEVSPHAIALSLHNHHNHMHDLAKLRWQGGGRTLWCWKSSLSKRQQDELQDQDLSSFPHGRFMHSDMYRRPIWSYIQMQQRAYSKPIEGVLHTKVIHQKKKVNGKWVKPHFTKKMTLKTPRGPSDQKACRHTNGGRTMDNSS